MTKAVNRPAIDLVNWSTSMLIDIIRMGESPVTVDLSERYGPAGSSVRAAVERRAVSLKCLWWGWAQWGASLRRVLRDRVTDTVAIQQHDIPNPGEGFDTRYWACVNAPVVDPDGELLYIVHRTEDVTGYVQAPQMRGDATRFRGIPGTGLRLTLARAITEQHGGTIAVNEPDEALTIFTVRLPAGQLGPTARDRRR